MGFWVSSLDDVPANGAFRKIRAALEVTAFGVNALVLPPGIVGRPHSHDTQDELYFVHRGRARFELPGETVELGPGGLLHVESTTPRCVSNRATRTSCSWSSAAKTDTSRGTAGRLIRKR